MGNEQITRFALVSNRVIFLGGSLLQEGSFYQGRQKIREKGSFRVAEGATKHFEYIFGKLVNKNAIKSGFWGGLGRNISKISKKCPFLGEN